MTNHRGSGAAPVVRIGSTTGPRRRRALGAVACCGVLVALCAGCGSSSKSNSSSSSAATSAAGTSTSSSSASKATGSVSLAMAVNYGIGAFSPLYYGLAQGYWKNRGVSVSIKDGTGSATVVDQVASGQFDFALVDTSVAAGLIPKGAKVKVVAELQNKSDIGIYCNAAAGVTKPADLTGKSLAATPGDSISYLLPAFSAATGVPLSGIKTNNMSITLKLSSVLNKEQNCATGYTSYAPAQISYGSKNAMKATAIPFAKYGINVVGYGLIGNTTFMAAHPQLTSEVVAGFLQSYYEAFKNPTASNNAGEAANPTAPSASYLAQLKDWVTAGIAPYWVKGEAFGASDKAAWESTLTALDKYLKIKPKPLSDYYTNQYIPKNEVKVPFTVPYS